MRVIIGFPMQLNIIEFEPFLGHNIEVYQEKFEEWYSKNYSRYSCYGKKKCAEPQIFDVNVVIKWIEEVAPEASPKILEKDIKLDDVDETLPGMYF